MLIPRCRISLRKSVQAFTSRVKQLEQFIVSQGLQVPEFDPRHASTINSLIAAYPPEPSGDMPWSATECDSGAVESVPTAHSTRVDEAMIVQPGQPQHSDHPSFCGDEANNYALGHANNDQVDLPIEFDLDWMLGLTNSDNPYGTFDMNTLGSTTFGGLTNHTSGVPSIFDDGELNENDHHDVPIADDDASSDEEDHKEVTGLISDRIGTLLDAAKGNWRFYGATSNLPLSKDRHVLQLEPRSTTQQQARIAAQLAFLELNHPFDAQLVQHLIRLYFTWQNSSLHIVDQHAFEQARDLHIRTRERTTVYTEFLVNAMSVSQCFSAIIDTDTSSGAQLVRLSRVTRVQVFRNLCQNTSPVGQKPSWRLNLTSHRWPQCKVWLC